MLNRIDTAARDRHGEGFAKCSPEDQLTVLMDIEAVRPPFEEADRADFKELKNLVVFGFCTTEVGATQLLAWDPVPGGFQGSVPYADIGRAWFS